MPRQLSARAPYTWMIASGVFSARGAMPALERSAVRKSLPSGAWPERTVYNGRHSKISSTTRRIFITTDLDVREYNGRRLQTPYACGRNECQARISDKMSEL